PAPAPTASPAAKGGDGPTDAGRSPADAGDSPDPAATDDPAASQSTDAHDTRIRLAVLTQWDGVTWHSGAEYRRAGRVLPAVQTPPGGGGDGDDALGAPHQISERIAVAALDGRLLPAIPAPRRVDGVRVSYDQATGTLLQADPLSPGEKYTV